MEVDGRAQGGGEQRPRRHELRLPLGIGAAANSTIRNVPRSRVRDSPLAPVARSRADAPHEAAERLQKDPAGPTECRLRLIALDGHGHHHAGEHDAGGEGEKGQD